MAFFLLWSLPMWLTALLLLNAAQATDSAHPCQRDCTGRSGVKVKPMTCRYDWLVENYLVLSRACYNCTTIADDCRRPDCVSADGVSRSIRTINRQLPGPGIQVCEGDTIEVKVVNQLMMAEGLTIHWHGLNQKKSQHMDGVSMVTQCPIPSFADFTYRYLAEDPGTHFYHSHSGLLRGEGIFGPLVIRQSASRDLQSALYDLDLPEHVISLCDWLHMPTVEMYSKFFHGLQTGEPANILINGRGAFPNLPNDTLPDLSYTKTTGDPLSRFDVKTNMRYRFRLFNAGALRCPMQFSIDHHSLLLIAADGQPLDPVTVKSLLIFSGERYDFVVETKKELAGLHWIRVKGLDMCQRAGIHQFAVLNYVDRPLGGEVLQYQSETPGSESLQTDEGVHFNQWFLDDEDEVVAPGEHKQIMNLTSLLPDDKSLKEKADRQIYLEFAYRFKNNYHYHDAKLYPGKNPLYKTVSSPMVNNISNLLPPSPLLTQPDDVPPGLICDFDSVADQKCDRPLEFCECVHVVKAKLGEVVEIVAYNSHDQWGFTHPYHLHGHTYRIVAAHRTKERMTYQRFLEMDRKGLIERRLHGAPAKDTLPIPNGGFLILRLVADNPGTWFMHCHVSFHAEVGMALTLEVRDEQGRLPAPPPDFPRCGSWQPRDQTTRALDDVSSAPDVKADDVSKPSGRRGGEGGGASKSNAWLVAVLVGVVAVDVVAVVVGVGYWRRKRRSRNQPLDSYTSVGMDTDSVMGRTGGRQENESSNLLDY